jgi:hypothetical protein
LILSEQAEPGTLADMGNDDNGDVWLLKPAHVTSDPPNQITSEKAI